MRRFVIVEKHRPWLWDEDFILYHDRDFLVVRAQRIKLDMLDIKDEDLVANNTFYRAFILFDKNTSESLYKDIFTIIAMANRAEYHHNGLPYCNNKRIFAYSLSEYVNIDVDIKSVVDNLIKKRDLLQKSIQKAIKNERGQP